MGAYIVPPWLTLIGGLVIFRRQNGGEVLFGLRSARQAKGQWCLPTGLGAIRRDITAALAEVPGSIENPEPTIAQMSERHQTAFASPAGFALAEARWYLDVPASVTLDQLDRK